MVVDQKNNQYRIYRINPTIDRSLNFSVKILGNNAALPAYNRHPTAQVVNHDDRLFLVDCGEGTQMRFGEYGVKRSRIHHIFISHLHGDHYFGLPGLLTSYRLLQRETPIHLYGPPELEAILEMLIGSLKSENETYCSIHFIPTQAEKPAVIYEDALLEVISFPTFHRIPCTGFLFKEKWRERKMRKDKIEEYQIPYQVIPGIKKGDHYETPEGKIISNEELTLDPPTPRAYAYCADTAYFEEMVPTIQGSNLIYHESTFTKEHEADAAAKFHSTSQQAARIAKLANANQLLLGHFSAKYADLQPLVDEARPIFVKTYLALEGYEYKVI